MLSVDIGKRLGAFDLKARFNAGPGVTVLFGRSGCGKTSALNLIAGLMRPDRGRIMLDGVILADADCGVHVPVHRRKIRYVFQEARLFPHLSVRANLLFGRWFSNAPRDEAQFARVVEMLGVGPLLARRPGGLSGGERQRVAIGRALLAAPRLLLMDEPLASLDEERKAEILPYIERLRDGAGAPIIYVSHSMAEVARLADKVVMMREGAVIGEGAPADMLHRADLLGPDEAETSTVFEAVAGVTDADGLVSLSCPLGELLLAAPNLRQGARVRVRIPARDVMLALTRPEALSALNVFPGRVVSLVDCGPAQADVEVECGAQRLWARLTRRSVAALNLAPGREVHAIVKSVALDSRMVSREL